MPYTRKRKSAPTQDHNTGTGSVPGVTSQSISFHPSDPSLAVLSSHPAAISGAQVDTPFATVIHAPSSYGDPGRQKRHAKAVTQDTNSRGGLDVSIEPTNILQTAEYAGSVTKAAVGSLSSSPMVTGMGS